MEINQHQRARVTDDFDRFIAALDDALVDGTEALELLSNRADRLMRSVARVRLSAEGKLSGTP